MEKGRSRTKQKKQAQPAKPSSAEGQFEDMGGQMEQESAGNEEIEGVIYGGTPGPIPARFIIIYVIGKII